MKWATLRSWFVKDRFGEEDREATAAAQRYRLHQAYQNVFNMGSEDVQLVLAHQAVIAGYFDVSSSHVPAEARAYADGKRAAYGQLLYFINLPVEKRQALLLHLQEEGDFQPF